MVGDPVGARQGGGEIRPGQYSTAPRSQVPLQAQTSAAPQKTKRKTGEQTEGSKARGGCDHPGLMRRWPKAQPGPRSWGKLDR